MNASHLKCSCGAVEVTLTGQPTLQYYCHCDDCQAVHGAAYACVLYPAESVLVSGETSALVLKTSPRTKCRRCGTYLFAEVPGHSIRGVNGALLPEGTFQPQFHMQCRYARDPIKDELPHFTSLPSQFGGSGELMQW